MPKNAHAIIKIQQLAAFSQSMLFPMNTEYVFAELILGVLNAGQIFQCLDPTSITFRQSRPAHVLPVYTSCRMSITTVLPSSGCVSHFG